jgi:uncharacterized membrane protein YfcA
LDDLSLWLALAVAVTAFVAATLGGIAGMGTAIITLPVLIFAFGVREAVPIVSVAMLFNMTSRAVANREFVDYRVTLWFAAGAIPGAALGAVVFASMPADLLARGLGGFLLLLVAWRHLPGGNTTSMPLPAFIPVGVGQGFLSAIFGGAGPFGAHFYLSYGLMRNAFVGTVAVGTLLIAVTKTAVYGGYSLIDGELLLVAVALGAIMAVGAYAGARIVRHVSDQAFTWLIEGVMISSGVVLAVRG